MVSGRSLLMEIGYNQATPLRERAAELRDLELVSIRKDLGGHERVVHLRKKS